MTGISKDDMLDRGGYAYAVPFYGKPRPILIDLVIQDQKEIESIYTNILRKGDQIIAEASTPMLNKGKGAYLWGILLLCTTAGALLWEQSNPSGT
jgi:hypothetical protein